MLILVSLDLFSIFIYLHTVIFQFKESGDFGSIIRIGSINSGATVQAGTS